ncbi:MAG: hypothetical protein NVS1B10_03190 [Candidatus Saccharimonadales bacterium]
MAKEPQFESVNRYVGNDIDRRYYESGAGYVIPEGIRNRSYEFSFRGKMAKLGLSQVEVDILTLRFVYDLSFRDIAKELSVVDVTTTYELYIRAMALLKKKG